MTLHTPQFEPRDPAFVQRVRESFARQSFMEYLGATLEGVQPGRVQIALTPKPELMQQHGFVHAGAVSSIADSACGYAALTLMPIGMAVLSIEFKVNLLEPAIGDAIIATGHVVRPGRTITVSQADVIAVKDGNKTLIATMQATMIALAEREGLSD